MGLEWIRVDTDVMRHPKTAALAHHLHIRRVYAAGHLLALWCAVGEHAESGSLAGVDDATIEEWADWTGKRGVFVTAMRAVGSLSDDDKREVRGFRKRNGYLVRERKRKRDEKKRRVKGARALRAPSAPTERNGTVRNVTLPTAAADEIRVAPDVPTPPAAEQPAAAAAEFFSKILPREIATEQGREAALAFGSEAPAFAEHCATFVVENPGAVRDPKAWIGSAINDRRSRPSARVRARAGPGRAEDQWEREVEGKGGGVRS